MIKCSALWQDSRRIHLLLPRGETAMKIRTRVLCTAIVGVAFVSAARTAAPPEAMGVPPTAAPDQAALLQSEDPKLAANKKLVFDMWRAIIQGGHTEMAPQYFTESYIQHNPNVATGPRRDGGVHEADAAGRTDRPDDRRSRSSPSWRKAISCMVATVSSRRTRRSPGRSTPARTSTCSGSRTARSPSTGTACRRTRHPALQPEHAEPARRGLQLICGSGNVPAHSIRNPSNRQETDRPGCRQSVFYCYEQRLGHRLSGQHAGRRCLG